MSWELCSVLFNRGEQGVVYHDDTGWVEINIDLSDKRQGSIVRTTITLGHLCYWFWLVLNCEEFTRNLSTVRNTTVRHFVTKSIKRLDL